DREVLALELDLAARGDLELGDALDLFGLDRGWSLRLGRGLCGRLRPGDRGARQDDDQRGDSRRELQHERKNRTTPLESEKWHNSAHFAMDSRLDSLERWLRSRFPNEAFTLSPASEDASFRRYQRARFAGGRSYVVMDAPPDKEDCRPYLHVAKEFAVA